MLSQSQQGVGGNPLGYPPLRPPGLFLLFPEFCSLPYRSYMNKSPAISRTPSNITASFYLPTDFTPQLLETGI